MSGFVKDKDNGYSAVRKKLYDDSVSQLDIGVLGYEALQTYDNGTTVWEAALYNEFGVPSANGGWRIPPRRWLRGWFDENTDLVRFWAYNEMVLVARNQQTKEQALANLAKRCVHSIKQRLLAGIPPENAEATVRKKGFNFPLFHTGKLVGAISYRLSRWRGKTGE